MNPDAKHTAEPWHRNVSAKFPIYAETGDRRRFRHIASVLGGDEEAEANLRRIVACVNACAGIPTRLLDAQRAPLLRLLGAMHAEMEAAGRVGEAFDLLGNLIAYLHGDNPGFAEDELRKLREEEPANV